MKNARKTSVPAAGKKKKRSKVLVSDGEKKNYVKIARKHLPMLTELFAGIRRKRALSQLQPSVVKLLEDIARNCLIGDLRGRANKDPTLCRCKEELAFLADKSIPIKNKKKIIQKGGAGFLGPLLSLGIPALVELIKKVV
jgi:hypothetical protein